jgi:hypothetical protein
VGVLGVNHIAFRTHDPGALRRFFSSSRPGDPLEGEHDPVRVGRALLVFCAAETPGAAAESDEIGFDVDLSGFDDVLQRARALGCDVRGPVDHTAHSKGFYLKDPDGRRLEFIHEDPGVYWQE